MTSTALAVLSDRAKLYEQSIIEEQQQEHRSGSPFPVLSLNSDPVKITNTDEQLEIPFGNFFIQNTNIFAPTVTLRPLYQYYIIMKRAGEKDNYKVLGETTYFKDWTEERLDSLGTTSCGRRFGKQMEGMSDEDKAAEKQKANLYFVVFGIAEFEGHEPTPVMLRLSGGKMVKWQQATDKKVIGVHYTERKFNLSAIAAAKDPSLTPQQRKDAKGANLIIQPNMDTFFPLTSEDKEIGGMFNEYIRTHNNTVLTKHVAASTAMVDITPDYSTENIIEADYIEELEDAS